MTVIPVLLFFVFTEVCVTSGASIYGFDTYESIFTHLGQVGSPNCKRHVQYLFENLQNFTAWANQMYDSGGRIPRSIKTGSSYLVGDFDNCVAVKAVDGMGVAFQGQYCVVSINILDEIPRNDFKSESENAHGNEVILNSKESSGHIFQKYHSSVGMDVVYWSLCIPSSCSHFELEEAMNKTSVAVGARNGVEIRVAVPPVDCSTLQESKKEVYEDAFIFTVSCLCLLSLLSTVFDYMIFWKPKLQSRNAGHIVDVFIGFSMRKNFEGLMEEPPNSDGLRILYGIRVISTILIIAFHRILYTTLAPLHNPDFLLSIVSTHKTYPCFYDRSVRLLLSRSIIGIQTSLETGILHYYPRLVIRRAGTRNIFVPLTLVSMCYSAISIDNMNTYSLMLFRSGEMAVDTFFTMSAFLLVNSLLRQRGKISIFQHVFKRYMRLTPVLLFTITALMILIDRMVDYPLWKTLVSLVQDPCLKNWLSNIMYVNNYEKVDDMCLVNAWYLGADMQLYLLSTFLMLLVMKCPSFAFPCFSIVTLVSIAIPFAVTLNGGISPVLVTILDKNIHPLVRRHMEHLYWPAQCRAGPYVVGASIGYLYFKIQAKGYKFPRFFSGASLLLSVICCFGPLYISTLFHDLSTPYSALGAAVFAGTNRFIWGLGIGILILNLATRGDGILRDFLGHKVFVFLGKLTYSSFMANILISVYFLGSTRQPIMLSNIYYITNILLDFFFTFFIGFFVHLIVEQPFRNLSELICKSFKMKDIQKRAAKDNKNN